jgi:hemin uptake protein HemP
MPTSHDASSVLNHPSIDQAGGGRGTSAKPPSQDSSSIESFELLRGSKTLGIRHNGALYLLRATKFGKLILTK